MLGVDVDAWVGIDIDVFVFQGERGIVLKPMVLKKYSHGGKPLSGSNKGGCKVL